MKNNIFKDKILEYFQYWYGCLKTDIIGIKFEKNFKINSN